MSNNKTPRIQYEQLFYNLLEASPLPVLIADRTLEVVAANQTALRLCGQQSFTTGQSLQDLLPEKNIVQLVQATIESGKAQKGQ
ncbi:MAG TPA: PAS domain-containing protein, partial [Ktedonobacteraceae bacterium]